MGIPDVGTEQGHDFSYRLEPATEAQRFLPLG
jgi:hypothetical protein